MLEGQFNSRHSGELFYRRWDADNAAKGVVLIVHGMAEHSLRYAAFAAAANAADLSVCAFDLPSHGKSSGRPGHIDRFDAFVNAVMDYRQQISEWFADAPVFLLGHSLGGLITTQVLLAHQDQFSGAVLSGPAVESPLKPGVFQFTLIRLLSSLAPKAGALQLDPAGVSRDQAVVDDYIADPLNYHGKVSARLVHELFIAMQDAQDRAAQIEIPMLIMHGGADSMTAVSGSQLLHDRISSTDKALKVYDGLYHEIFNEPEGPEIIREAVDWLAGHC